MRHRFLLAVLIVLTLAFAAHSHPRSAPSLKTKAVVLIVMDGFRWQEVFNGPEHDLMNSKYGSVQDEKALRAEFWRDTPEEGRAAMMPFLWNTIAKNGQIYGNQHKGSVAQVTNGYKFSYPGYNEIARAIRITTSTATHTVRIPTPPSSNGSASSPASTGPAAPPYLPRGTRSTIFFAGRRAAS